VSQAIAEINARGFQDIQDKHARSDDGYKKYLDLDSHVSTVVREASRLGLLRTTRKRVLDLGCGTGCFLYVLKAKGHDVVGIDIPDHGIFNDMIQALSIPRLSHRITAFQALPDFSGNFDLITAFSVCFDLHRTADVWGPREWNFFLEDCRSRLRPGGRVFLNFNPATTRGFSFVPDEVATLLRRIPGGRLSASKEFFSLLVAGS